jgi:Tfp pilus assembly protein FimT
MALSEVVISTAVAGMVAATVAAGSVPLVARERLQAATHELQSTLNISRMEAISRNRPARFVLDAGSRSLETWDTMGTSTTADDELIRRVSIPGSVSLARPDKSEAVTLTDDGNNKFEVTFATDGSVAGTGGDVGLAGGGKYTMISLHGTGSSRAAKWADGQWVTPGGAAIKEIPASDWDAARDGFDDDWSVKLEETINDPVTDDTLTEDPLNQDTTTGDGTTKTDDTTTTTL